MDQVETCIRLSSCMAGARTLEPPSTPFPDWVARSRESSRQPDVELATLQPQLWSNVLIHSPPLPITFPPCYLFHSPYFRDPFLMDFKREFWGLLYFGIIVWGENSQSSFWCGLLWSHSQENTTNEMYWLLSCTVTEWVSSVGDKERDLKNWLQGFYSVVEGIRQIHAISNQWSMVNIQL